MEEKITVSAKTLDEAITKALIELQTTSEHLQYEVVQKESTGFLGIFGSKPCVIRARIMNEAEERAKREEKTNQKQPEIQRQVKEEAAKHPKKMPERQKPEETSVKEQNKEKAAEGSSAEQFAELPVHESRKACERSKEGERRDYHETKKDSYKREYSKRDRKESLRLPERAVDETFSGQQKRERAAVVVNEEAVKKAAKEFLEQVFDAMQMQVVIEPVYDDSEKELFVKLTGDDMGILIGKRGQTLDSLQYLVSLVVNKETEGYLRVKLDTENYRERRKETLETLARNISYKVKRTKHPVSLEPMNPYERRIIHSALQNDRYVVTRSEGEDPYRHVVISLKSDRSGSGRKERYSYKKDRNRNAEINGNTAADIKNAVENTEDI